jgi:hypothetical protein
MKRLWDGDLHFTAVAFFVVNHYSPLSGTVGDKAEIPSPVRYAGLELLRCSGRREYLNFRKSNWLRPAIRGPNDHGGRRQGDCGFQFVSGHGARRQEHQSDQPEGSKNPVR